MYETLFPHITRVGALEVTNIEISWYLGKVTTDIRKVEEKPRG
jgi:hypothetical protein